MATVPLDIDDDASEPDIDMLVAFLREEETKSIDETLDQERANALDFYNGEPFGDEEEGRSQVVTRDVAEVVDYMTVSLLRTMVSGDRVVEFDCADKDVAAQATTAVSQQFYQGQDGYRMLADWIKAGLLEKTSTAKICVIDRPPQRREAEVPAEALAQLSESGAQIVAAEETEAGTWRVAILVPQPPEFRDYVVPNEEFGVAPDARDLDSDCVYRRFTVPRTLSQLAEMGFDTEDLSDDYGYSGSETLSQARDFDGDMWRDGRNRQGANRRVWHHEEYATYDLNGDGVAELLQIHRVGNTILRRGDTGKLAIEEIDDQPGVIWCPFPMPHRIVGQSLADKVMDIQRINSVLLRQGLDNLYQSNSPRMAISESSIGDTTLDDLLTVRAGGIVRYLGAQAPQPITLPFVAQSAFEVMEVMRGEKESRTGITRLNQGLDADALNKTATGTALMQAQGQQIEEYLARNFAEAFARLMLKKYHLMRRFGQPMAVMIDGESVQVDPRQWPEEINIQVRVGLGSGRKEQRVQNRMTVLQIMQAIAQSDSRTVSDQNIYNAVKGLIADMNLGNVRDLLTDPATLPQQEEQPDPEMAKAQADAMLAARKQESDEAKAQADQAMRAQQMQIDAAMKDRALEADLQAKRERSALEMQLARDKAAFEADLAAQKADREYQLALLRIEREHELAQQRQVDETSLPTNRPGGALDE